MGIRQIMCFGSHEIAYRRNKPFFMLYTVTINATSKCNFKCGMCFARRFDREGEELETHHFYSILDEMSRYKIRDRRLSGGEPFMRGDLPDIIEYANERHINVNIITNGALVTKNKLRKIIRSGKNSFTISIDAPNPEINDDLRDHRAYQKAVKNARSHAYFNVIIHEALQTK